MAELSGKLLIAARAMSDPNFAGAVILMVEHNEEGALGLITNRPTEVTLRQVWQRLHEQEATDDEVDSHGGLLHHGGPCDGILMVLHQQPAHAERTVIDAAGVGPVLDAEPGGGSPAGGGASSGGVLWCQEAEHVEAVLRQAVQDVDAEAPTDAVIKCVAGYAGWGPGQLEAELGEGAWLLADASAKDVFSERDPWLRLVRQADPESPLSGMNPAIVPDDPANN
jgi:putative transcriptional regulator